MNLDLGFSGWGILGSTATLLNAPRSGKAPRQQVAHISDEVYYQARDTNHRQCNDLEEQIETLSQEARNRSKSLMDIGRDFIEEQRTALGRGAKRVRKEVIEPETEAQPEV